MPVALSYGSEVRPCPNTVLLVEDDPDIREVLSFVISEAGYSVACAQDGQEAMEFIERRGSPSLILLDLLMPRMDGSAFLRSVSRRKQLQNIPIVIVSTAEPSENERRMARKFIRKPMNVDDILRTVLAICPDRLH